MNFPLIVLAFADVSEKGNSFLCFMYTDLRLRFAERRDCKAVFRLICELADFEKAPEEVIITAEDLEQDAFGSKPIVEIIVAEINGEVVGAALVFEKYSTWKGRTLHLEDLIVSESHRGKGLGTKLFAEVLEICKQRNYQRLEWQVLDWNQAAIDFYNKYGTQFLKEWLSCRLPLSEIQKL